jgi:hypothetical protein
MFYQQIYRIKNKLLADFDGIPLFGDVGENKCSEADAYRISSFLKTRPN